MEQKGYRLCIINHSKQADHFEYLMQLVGMGENSISIQFLERYSNLKNLNDSLRKETNSSSFPRFPPKKFFGSTDEKFLNQRQTELNSYFDSIFNSEEFSKLPSLKKWIDEAIKKYAKESVQQTIKVPEPQPNTITQSNSIGNNENVIDRNSNNKNSLTASEIQKMKEMIEQCSKQLIDMGNNADTDFQADVEKEKEYSRIVKENKAFSQEQIETSCLFKIEGGKDENFDIAKDDKVKETLSKCEEISTKIIEYSVKIGKEITDGYSTINLITPI